MDIVAEFGTIATDALAAIGDLLPIVVPVFGALVLIPLGIGLFRKFGVRR